MLRCLHLPGNKSHPTFITVQTEDMTFENLMIYEGQKIARNSPLKKT